jgi:hypothetical protein
MRNVGRSIGELVTLLQDLRPQRPPIFPRYDDLYHCHPSLQVRSYPLYLSLSLSSAQSKEPTMRWFAITIIIVVIIYTRRVARETGKRW